ncbi:MAG: 16S rRNA (cytosine(1402)-N(4))-methyltransferase, partial [Parcubacteria group bacterium RIFOXYD2_FULL_52_8]
MPTVHKPVLLQEVLDGLDLWAGMTVVDGTINAAGHAYEIGKRLGKEGMIIGIDADPEAITRARERLGQLPCTCRLFLGNFRHLRMYLEEAGIHQVDAVLLDLGLSSDQLETSGRGFTFQKDEPLQMTFA